ncbi:MAG: shikimate kinase [Alphaproteobacteria bacterium]
MSRISALAGETIVLVGLMGSGKSSIGRRLASRLGIPFVDADAEIEAAAGCTIAEFFERHGEAAFRDGERRVIARLLVAPPQVLATGGGAFVDSTTRALVGDKALSVWLRAELDLLVKRCGRRNTRPLLREGNPREILARLIDERYPIYAETDVIIDTDDSPHETMVDRIIDALEAYQRDSAGDQTD